MKFPFSKLWCPGLCVGVLCVKVCGGSAQKCLCVVCEGVWVLVLNPKGYFQRRCFCLQLLAHNFFDLLDQQKDPTFFALCDIEKVQACHFRWRSWLWQQKNIPGGHLSKQPRLLPVVTVGPSPLLHIAAHCAFWKLPKGVVVDCGKLVGAVVAASCFFVSGLGSGGDENAWQV